MKVVHVAQSVKGGVATYLSEVLSDQAFRYGNDRVLAVIPKGGREEVGLGSEYQCFEFSNVSRSITSLFSAAKSVVAAIDDFDPDIVHLHSTFAGLLRIPLFLRRKYKVVYCAHGWAFSQKVGILKKIIYGVVEKVLLCFTAKCINISFNDAKEARQFFISGEKVVTIPNGVTDIADYSESSRLELCSDRTLRLLFVGRFDRQKGVDRLINVFEQYQNDAARLTLIGASVVDSAGYDFSNDPRIEYLGWLKRGDVINSLSHTHALVIPSRWEGFGLVAIEAMRSGVAVICSDVGELPSIVQNGRSGMVFSSEADLLGIFNNASIDRLITMGLVGRSIYLEKYTAAIMNRKIADVYESLMK